MSRLDRTASTVLTFVLVLAGCETADTEPLAPAFSHGTASHQTAPVRWHGQQQLIALGGNGKSGVVGDASARLVRNRNGISYQIHAAELNPGNAYSLWLVVVNNPAACAASPCSAADLFLNAATDAQVRSGGTGTVAGASGMAAMAGTARVGPLSGWLDGRSLGDPYGVEVHLVLNDHGPLIPAFMPGMISTYRAGCANTSPFPGVFPATAIADGEVGPNTCLLYQVAIFQPQ